MHGRNEHRLAQVGSSWEGRPSPRGQDAKAAAFCWAAGSWLLGAAPLSPPSACPSPPAAPRAVLHITWSTHPGSGRFSQHGQAGCIHFMII